MHGSSVHIELGLRVLSHLLPVGWFGCMPCLYEPAAAKRSGMKYLTAFRCAGLPEAACATKVLACSITEAMSC